MFKPETRVPGAMRATAPAQPGNPKSVHVPMFDKKGRPMWHAPHPSGQHQHRFKVRGQKDPSIQLTPLHRGVAASLACYYRAQARRNAREGKKARYDLRGIPTGGFKTALPRGPKTEPRVTKLPV